MSLVRCENGHFYDNTKFKHCPHCGRNTKERSDWTIPLFGKKAGKQQTASGGEKVAKESGNEDANLTLPEQIAKAYMEEGKASVSVKTFYAEEIPETPVDVAQAPGQAPAPAPASEKLPDMVPASEKSPDLAPASGKYITGWLVCIKGNLYGRSFDVYEGENIIGRGEDADVCLAGDDYVSRKAHGVIGYDEQENTFFVKPGNGREAFYVNDKIVLKKTEISDGDTMEIGRSELIFKAFCGQGFRWKKQEQAGV